MKGAGCIAADGGGAGAARSGGTGERGEGVGGWMVGAMGMEQCDRRILLAVLLSGSPGHRREVLEPGFVGAR